MAIRIHGSLDRPAGPLFTLYERYVGEPRTRKDVYGYWAFILGYVLGLLGVTAYLVGGGIEEPDFLVREVSIAASAVGLALAMFGVGLLLPVRRRGIQASVAGLAIALASVAAFAVVYPGRWTTPTDASGAVITAYTAGVAIVAGVAAMVPVLTGEKGWLVSEVEDGREHPPVLVGEAAEGALFTLYQVGTGAWTWRVVHQEALGENAAERYSRPDIESAVEALRSTLADARLLEITTAAFRLYRTEEGGWRWTLMAEDGGVVATSAGSYAERDAAGEATSLLKERGPGAPVIDVAGAAFDCYEEDGRWRWRLLDDGRTPLAAGPGTFADREAVEAVIDDVRARIDDAPVLALDALGVELVEAAGEWHWRLVDAEDEVVATGRDGFGSRRAAESAASDLLPALGRATTMEAGVPGYELFEERGEWWFRLVDDDGDAIARSHEPYADGTDAGGGVDWMAATVGEADVVQYDDGAYEVHPDGDAWRWRLVTEDRDVVASSTDGYHDAAAAEAAVQAVCDRAREADLIEFENAAFQQYESDGRWRWRLIDEDGNVMADSGEDYASRAEVGEAMATLKEHAPTAEILEIEEAAFELYQDEGGAWGWRLIDEAGAMVAEGAARHPSRAAAKEAMDYLVSQSEDESVRTMERAAFQLYADAEGTWRWRYLHPDGTTVAEGTSGHATRDQLVEAVADLRDVAETDEVRLFDPLGVELAPRGAGWRFRVVDRDRETVAESAGTYESREAAAAAVDEIREHGPDATVFAIDQGAFRIASVSRDGAYRWELVDGERSVLAVGPSTYEDPARAEAAADRVAALASDAKLVDFDTAAFQLDRDGPNWGWRLVAEDGTTVASGAAEHGSRAEAEEAVDAVRSYLPDASVLEIDDAAFELHHRSDGWTWRLVDATGAQLARSVEAYPTRSDARASLASVKEHGPEGWISAID